MAHPYLLSFAKHGSHDRYDYVFGTIGPPGELHLAVRKYEAGSLAMSLGSKSSYPYGMVRLATWLRRHRIDLVQTHLFTPCLIGIIAAWLARGPRSIFTAHHVSEWEVARLGSRRAAVLDRMVRIHFADHVVAPSDYIARALMTADGHTETGLTVIPHGVELERFITAREQRPKIRSELGVEDATVLGAVGRLSPVKNYPVLIRAFSRIAAEDPSLVLVIAGHGETGDLSKLTASLGLKDKVKFVGWWDDMPKLLAAFDVAVHVSLAETFGLSLLEAAATGLPVIASRVGVAPTLVEDGISGLLLADSDEAAVVHGLKRMLELRSRWRLMGSKGQQRAEQYSAARMVVAHEALYDRLLAA
jgi:glycosyltransferase involved in cell wall biosynthesis